MAYTTFTDETVFANATANALCNLLLDTLITSHTEATVEAHFAMTGTLAKILQGDTPEAVLVLPFITDSDAIFETIAQDFPVVFGVGGVVFPDRVQMIVQGIYFEFWHTETLGTINTVTGLQVQDVADIPVNIN